MSEYNEEPIRDKAQPKDWKDLMSKYREIKRQDIIALAMKLLDPALIWYHTNIQNNQHLERILQARVYTDIASAHFSKYQEIPDDLLSKEEKAKIANHIKATNETILNVTEHYAELRKSAKGLTAKQIERMTSGVKTEKKELDHLFKNKEKNAQ